MSDDSLFGGLADEFIDEVKRGKLPEIEEYAAKNPDWHISLLYPQMDL